ncbi:MAG: hypothetical protein Q7S03_00955 [bacterium]|nr:hypothetical protein [bacterium]
MANLTVTAYHTRRAIKYGSISLASFLILRILWGIGSTYWNQVNPPPPPPPTIAFGKIPAITFVQKENLPAFTYKLETIDGAAPKLETVGKVYLKPKPVASLLALDRAKVLAKKLGFEKEPTKLTEREYRFQGENGNMTLDIDIISQKLKMRYDFAADQSIFTEKKLPGDDQAIMEAKNFLKQAELLAQDLEEGQAKVSFWRYIAPNLVPAISLSEADLVRVDLFRANLDDFKILPPDPKESAVSLVFSGVRTLNRRVVELNYAYSAVNKESFATYPLKSSTVAWQVVNEGKAFIASAGQNNGGQIIIRKAYMAYLDTDGTNDFLQPVFVFEGDKDFIAYVSAVDSKWTE